MDPHIELHHFPAHRRHSCECDHHPLSAAIAKNRMGNAYSGPKRRRVLEVKVLSRLFIYVLYTSDIELASATGRDLWRLYACLTTSLCAMNALQGAK